MAKDSVATRVQDLPVIERCEQFDIGLAGLLHLLVCETHGERGDLGQLTTEYLVTVTMQARNAREAMMNGLTVVADMMHAFDSTVAEVDTNSVGWLVQHLTDTLEKVRELEWSARQRLIERGYGEFGHPLPSAR